MKVAVLGARGLVGEKLIEVLLERNFYFDELHLFATEEDELKIKDNVFKVRKFNNNFNEFDIVFSCLDTDEAYKILPGFKSTGAKVIDNSAAFRLKDEVPLVIPEMNKEEITSDSFLIANPNCSTIQLVLSLSPFLKKGIKRVFVATYQSVSGAGKKGLEAYNKEKEGETFGDTPFPKRIFENLFPWIGEIEEEESIEERKIKLETRKILKKDFYIFPLCVRVCVPYVHSQVVFIELEEKITREEAVESILEKDYLEFSEDILSPLDFKDRDNVGICRFNVYQDGYVVRFFSVMDNLRKGAATNAVQIAEEYVRK